MKKQGKVTPFDSDKASSAIIGGAESIVETNKRGGKQSKIKGRMTEVPPLALIEVSSVMALGAENYPRDEDGVPNWYNISCSENIDHAMEHVANYLAERNRPLGDGPIPLHERCRCFDMLRDELSHATARMMMAMEQFIREEV